MNAAVLWYTNKERPRSLRAAGAFAQAAGWQGGNGDGKSAPAPRGAGALFGGMPQEQQQGAHHGDHGTDGADRCVDFFGFRVVFLGLQVIKTGGQDQDTDDGQRDGGEVLPDADGGDEGQGYQHVGLDVEGGDEANDGLQYDGDAAEDDGHPRGVKGQRQQPEDTDQQRKAGEDQEHDILFRTAQLQQRLQLFHGLFHSKALFSIHIWGYGLSSEKKKARLPRKPGCAVTAYWQSAPPPW